MIPRTLAIVLVLTIPGATLAQFPRAMKIDDLFAFQRLSDAQISPDGKQVVYVQSSVNLDANKITTHLWLVSSEGGRPRQLTTTGSSNRHPRWSPDGRSILFESNRSGDTQLWLLTLDGGEARQLTNLSTGATSGLWSPDGKSVAFLSSVWPEFSDRPFKESEALNRKRLEEKAQSPVKARVFTRLFFRHWDNYVEDRRDHLFIISLDNPEPRDLTPGDRDANPTSSTFSLGDDFTFSPDGKYLYFTASPARDEAWSTNFDICRVPVAGGKIECLTKDNPAADGAPRFSPDGKYLAWRAQKRPGYEADRWVLRVQRVEGGGPAEDITSSLDSSVEEFVWSHDSQRIYFIAEERASSPVCSVHLHHHKIEKVLSGGTHSHLSISRDGAKLACLKMALNHPNEVFVGDLGGSVRNVSHANTKLLQELDFARPESVTVKGSGGVPMQMWLVKPPGFDPNKRWPLAFLVHGGPQGAWADSWSFRWCPQLWASQGYVVALPNPRGSTGFGQKYVDEISGDWGGKCYEDLMGGMDWLEKQPWIDRERMGAAGASFGGYMINWFAVNTGRFKCLISHCGIWNFESMYGTTDELWFDEWEHGGPPWGKRDSYEKHSPHRFARNLAKFRTPTLIIHGDLDFRVPVSEGVQFFTTLQRLRVPSRMLNFPDEGHWVLRPRNSEFWHREVFGWLAKYVSPGGR